MKKMIYWGKFAVVLALISTNWGGLKVGVQAATEPSTQLSQTAQLAQIPNNAANQCRATNATIPVLRGNQLARWLNGNELVTLAENQADSNGWIAIQYPIVGFVEARYLKSCSGIGTGSPLPPNSSLCRRVITDGRGLIVRQGPSAGYTQLGRITNQQQVWLSNPIETSMEGDREWVKIYAPLNGWVSNGFPRMGDMNLFNCNS